MFLRRLGIVSVLLLASALGFAWYAGGKLIAPVPRAIGQPPPDLGAVAITFPSDSGSTIHGWFARGAAGNGAILLLHGVRGDRRDMVPRASFLHSLGYSVLAIDFQAHGEIAWPAHHVWISWSPTT